jgi:hypothetical protein
MTAPLHAREIKGKGRWYGRCDADCPFGDDLLISVTNAQGVVAKPALVPSAVKITAEKAWDVLPRMVSLSRQDPAGPNGCAKKRVDARCGDCRFCLTAAMKKEHDNIWEHARDTGTRIHAAAHSEVLRQPYVPDPEVAPFVDQYLAFLKAWGVDIDEHVEAAETTILHRKAKYAGTGDLWIWLPTGPKGVRQLWLVDIKTSLAKPVDAVYRDQVLQLAGLRYAPEAILPDDTVVPVPEFAGAALLNLRRNEHALIPVPATKAAHRAFVNAVGLQTFLLEQDTKSWQPLDVPALPEPKGQVA